MSANPQKSKIYLFKDQKDYIKDLTDDNVINVIGTKGSGKTTSTIKYINDDKYIVVNCDRLLELPSDIVREDIELPAIREMLIKKYGKILEGKAFISCYNDIVSYIKRKNKKAIIEGNIIQDIEPITQLKGKVIVKRTGIIKSFIRSIKRDYPNKYFLEKEIEKHGKILGRYYRLQNIINRRKNIFKYYHNIERIISELKENDKNDVKKKV